MCDKVKWKESGYESVVPTACNYKNRKPYTRETRGFRFAEFFFPFSSFAQIWVYTPWWNKFIYFKKSSLFLDCKVAGGRRGWEPLAGRGLCPRVQVVPLVPSAGPSWEDTASGVGGENVLGLETGTLSDVCSSPRLFGLIDPAGHHQSLEESSLPSDKKMNVISRLTWAPNSFCMIKVGCP